MKSLRNYTVPFSGLALGKHHFEYHITDEFFAEFDYSLVKKADLQCNVELEKQETMLILTFHIKGTIGATCDRCLSDFSLPVDIHEQQIVKFADEEIDESDEIITLGRNEHELMLGGLIYEYVNVAVPFTAICSDAGEDSQCDKDMLDKLNSLSANNEETEQTDPRWEALKKIK